MKAARLYGIKDIRIEDVPTPKPSSGEILLKVKAAAVCGTDVRMWGFGAKGVDAEHPLILGHEFSGVIEELGSQVSGYEVGQSVAVAPNMGCGICDLCVSGNGQLCEDYKAFGVNIDGGFAEYVLIPEKAVRGGNIVPIDGISFEAGALNEPLSCAFNGSSHCRIRPGNLVLVVGAGVIGIMHAFLAKMAGAGKVVLSDLEESRLEKVKELDPDFITVGALDIEKVKELTLGHLFDVIITACPSPAAQASSFSFAAVNGRICFFGGLPKEKEEVALNTNIIHYKQLLVTGTTRASHIQYRDTLRFIKEGLIPADKLITKKAPLEDINVLFSLAERAIGLKNVVEF
ncbi:MAG: alcohol dehydrogenase catalytic domain-containing protein [Lachnospiraceae bacterium]|jgi:L-iditol 2-dehydrogenase|nr:alcohol dehydrogenase catalytic domain-containing protein [Lachnospiraceae bacterium]